MKYINGTRTCYLTLGIDDVKVIKWYVDISYGVHPDLRSHTGRIMTMGTGALQSGSTKQKINTRSGTEAELVDDVISKILQTKLFIEEQGYEIEKNILFQDNKETNGRKSAGKRSRHINIRYFFVTDQVRLGNMEIRHCPTDNMIGDYMTKPSQGEKVREFRRMILGMEGD